MKQTTLDLNGPVLSFTTNPVGVASTGVISESTGSGIATFIGIATATFPTGISTGSPTAPTNVGSNSGIITYRWYEVGVGALSDSAYVTGTGTTTLTLSKLITPTDNQRQFYLTAAYIPSAYQSSTPITAGTARSTGNAVNETIISETGTLTVYPLIEIIAQPSSLGVPVNSTATFNVVSTLSDNTFPDDLVYEWYYKGNLITDGTIVDGYLQSSVTTTQINYQTVVSNITRTDPVYETVCQDVYENRTRSVDRSNTVTFTSPGSITLPSSSYNVKVRVAGARGGNGGSDAASGGGNGTGGRFGEFNYASGGRTLTFSVGKRGNDGGSNVVAGNGGGGRGGDGLNRGGDGGNVGSGGGASGGGGGGGGSTGVFDSNVGRHTIIASGGGGGGGASLNVPGAPANPGAGGFEPDGQNRSNGTPGGNGDNDGGGGGGGGAGTNNSPNSQSGSIRPIQVGGRGGRDKGGDRGTSTGTQALGGGNDASPTGGGLSFGGFDRSLASFAFNGSQNDGDGYGQVSYNWTENVTERVYVRTDCQQVKVGERTVVIGQTTSTIPVPTTVTSTANTPINVTFSGSKSPSLSIRADQVVGLSTVFCRISSRTATNSVVNSNIVEYKSTPTAEQYIVNLEQISLSNTSAKTTVNLANGEYTINKPSSSSNVNFIVLYTPDANIPVEVDLYGGKGDNAGSYLGGEGGFSRIRFVMERNVEYVIAGLADSINTPFIYKKGQLIACVGKGGNAGTGGRGGFGGGVNVGGESGSGRGAGSGGPLITVGNLGANGVFGSLSTLSAIAPDTKAVSPNGGRTTKCSKGEYWQAQGVSACADVGTTQFRLSDGTVVTNTASITRGFKAGYDIRQTAGAGNGGGNGGFGATGGNGGITGGGGGGGSGYSDGSVTLVSTQLGGNFGNPKVVIRRAI
jgi:hypothetical protein